ncbi:MAG: glycosyltransferase family 39 protein [Verrucomicrobia bacterium]|nr:glycosyltransferase family 39 protein [Verrucomicrobiota bacterium]
MAKRQLLFPALILLLAALVRLSHLDIKPPHFDEGINGWFCDQMSKTGYYAYDPTNYHGPLHFYVLFVSLKLFGRNLWALRLPVVLASLIAIFWIFLFRPFFSRTICYLAALGMAISPGFIFYDRYSIHESWMVLFLIITFWGILGVSMTRKPRYFWSLTMGVTGMILTKETYIIHLAAFAAAGFIALIGSRLTTKPACKQPAEPLPFRHVAAAILVGALLIVFFYSGTFKNWNGLAGLYQTFLPWTKTGIDAAGHGKPDFDLFPLAPPFLANVPFFEKFANLKLNWYWVRLLLDYEWFALAGLLFSVRFLFGGLPALRYLALYALCVLFAYSIIPYKTPWCIISIAWPFLFLGAALIEFVAERLNRLVAVLVSLPLFAQAAWKSYDLNFVRYDNPKDRYVYVQTDREYHTLVDPILAKGAKDPGSMHEISGLILLPSYFPLPWVLGDFPNIGYYTSEVSWPEKMDADFIAVEKDKADDLEKRLKSSYFKSDFRLRDGMDPCRAFFRYKTFRDLYPGRTPEFEPSQPNG